MKRKLSLLALMALMLFSVSPVLADDGFYVVAVGGGVGTKITSLPYTINSPGFYYLGGNLSYTGSGNGITVSSNAVTIDLMGFEIKGPGSNVESSIAIFVTGGYRNIEVRNGSITGWYMGLRHPAPAESYRTRALNLRVAQCNFGIYLEQSKGSLVKGCSVEAIVTGIMINGGVATGNILTNCAYGILGNGTISSNYITNCSSIGISCLWAACSIIGNTVVTTESSQSGIYIWTNEPCLVTQNTVSGPGTHFRPGGGTVNVANTNAGF
jgi:hypothetical protein